jgi:hypothetical protein
MGDPLDPNKSPWHLFGAYVRHWRETVRHLPQRDLAKSALFDQAELSRWERGLTHPHYGHVEMIDSTLNADGYLLALHRLVAECDLLRQGTIAANTSAADEDDMERRTLLQVLAAIGTGAAIPASAIDQLHSRVRRLTGPLGDNSAEDWEQIAWDYAQGVWTEPPGAQTADLVGDINALDHKLARTTNAAERMTLLRVYAQLAAFLAYELVDVSSARASWRSWRVARAAADACGDRGLSVWVRAAEASESFYQGRPGPIADTLAQQAIHLADGRPGFGLACALKIRSRVLATQGRPGEARATLHELRDVHERLPSSVTDDHISVWGLPLESIQYAEAFALTKIGDTRVAQGMLAEALAASPQEKAGGRANISLIQAWGLVHDRHVTEGLQRALDVTQPLPVTIARRKLVTEITAALPEKARRLPAARELRALVAV